MVMILSSESIASVVAGLGSERVRRDVVLAPYTTFRIGGPADLFYEATTAEEIARAVTAARTAQVPFFMLGLGANILVGDRGFRGLVVRNTAARWRFSDSGQLWSETGAVIATLIPEAVRRGWSGLEHYVGIPSTVGGAVWQNLHFLSPAPARERTVFIAEVVYSVELCGLDGVRRAVSREEMEFGYDTSLLHRGKDIALAVTLQLVKGDIDVMQRVMQENLSWRGAKHPWLEWHPSVGSIFKKIEGVGAGRLIDQSGLKGVRCGDAQVSHVHANIIVNLGHATANDVRALIARVQDAVWAKFSVRLESEISFVGEF